MTLLYLGGASSGKSAMAQSAALRLAGDASPIYLATMRPVDEEDRLRILKHRENRRGLGFETLEQAADIACVAPLVAGRTVLLDSITALLTNEFFKNGQVDEQAATRVSEGLLTLSSACLHLVAVGDDPFRDAERFDSATRLWLHALAMVYRALAPHCDGVCEAVAGRAAWLRGASVGEDYA